MTAASQRRRRQSRMAVAVAAEDVNPYEASAGENQGVSCGFSWLVSGWLIHATSGIVGG